MPSSLDSEQQHGVAKVDTRQSGSIPVSWYAFGVLLAAILVALIANSELRGRALPALALSSCFAVAAWLLRGVTRSGAAAGFIATAVIFIAAGPAFFGAMVLLFVLTYGATRFGRERKQALAIAEQPSGRDAGQIFANVGVAAICAALAQVTRWRTPFLVGSLAALAEAACDTVSSETGKVLTKAPRLITSWRPAIAGTNGAISGIGTLLGALAAVSVALEAAWTGILTVRLAMFAGAAAVFGMLFDSLLGATLESQQRLTNNRVNLASTALSSLLAALAAWQFS